MSFAVLDPPMPKESSEEPGTKTVRLPAELVEALGDIAYAKKLKKESFSIPVYLAAMVREQILRDRVEAKAFIKRHK